MANTLQLVLQVDNKPGNQAIGAFNKNLGSIEAAALNASQGAGKAFQGIDQMAVRASASVKSSFGGLKTVFAGLSIGALAKSVFDIASGFERSRVGLKAFVGDARTADALFKDIQAFAEKSPFEFKDLLTGAQRLLAFKTQAQDVVPTLRAISATIGATGGDAGNFDGLIKAIGDIQNKGRVTGEEIRQLTNQGVPAIDLLAKGFGKSSAEIQKAITDGIVPADGAIRVLISGMTERFGKFDDEVAKTSSVAFSNFRDTVQRVTDDVASRYLPAVTKGINEVRDVLVQFGDWIKNNQGTIKSLGILIGEIGAAIITFKVVAGLQGVADALVAVRAATVANPWALIAAGFVLVGTETYRANQAFLELKKNELDDSLVQGLLKEGKTAKQIEELANKAGIGAERIQEAVKRVTGGGDFKAASQSLLDRLGMKIGGSEAAQAAPKIEQFNTALRDQEQAATASANANKRSAEILERAQRGELTGLARVVEEYRQYRAELGITEQARKNLSAAQLLDIKSEAAAQLRKMNDEDLKAIEAQRDATLDSTAAQFKAERDLAAQVLDLRAENIRSEVALQEGALAARRERELRGVEAINAVTVDQKIAVEQQKAGIEQQYLQQALQVKRQLLDVDERIELAKAAENAELKLAIEQKYQIARRQLDAATQADIDAVKENATIRSGQIAIDANQQIFDRFKSQAEGVFDALIRTSKTGWSSIADSLKAALLTAIKDVVTSQIARMLFGLTTGQSVQFASPGRGGGGGILGGLLGLGAEPVFGGGSITGGPGGTGGFTGAVGGASGVGGGAFSKAALGAQFAQYKSLLTQLGNLGPNGYSAAGTWMKAPGVKGAAGGAMLLGGGILAMDGIRRGGWAGLGETTVGGALIGAKFGGPVGALIGGAIGFGVGLFGLFRTKAEDRIIKRVRETYGFEIEKKFAKDQLLPIIKQQFGGDIEMGLRSPAVRELIELYAMSRGLNTNGIVTRATGSVFASRGGAFQQVPTFQNGAPAYATGGVPSSQPVNLTLTIEGKAASAVMRGETVQVLQDSPRQVSRSADAGASQRSSRDAAAAQLVPNFVV